MTLQELDFWKQVFLSAIQRPHMSPQEATIIADMAVAEMRKRTPVVSSLGPR